MNISSIVTGICSLLFFMIGADKFLNFLEPQCSFMDTIHPTVWSILGVLQIAGGILIWIPKFRKYVAGFFFLFMTFFIVYHLMHNTNDIGGAVTMAILLGIISWDPSFKRGKQT